MGFECGTILAVDDDPARRRTPRTERGDEERE
jgi:hypothetical protein